MKENTEEKVSCNTCRADYDSSFIYCPHCGSVKPYQGEIRNVGLIILNCLDCLRVNCGRTLLSRILTASKSRYVTKNLTKCTFFAALNAKYKPREVMKLIDYLIDKEYIELYKSEAMFKRPLIRVTEKGKMAIMNKNEKIINKNI